jgi:hypothetical protein
MLYKYTPLYRPPGFATVPAGWTLVERPKLSCGFDRRTDLPISQYTYGVIAYEKPLIEAEIRQYQLMPV